MSSHPATWSSIRHAQLAIDRHVCYRRLARAILGPPSPLDDLSLTRALAEHAKVVSAGRTPRSLPNRPAAAA